MSKYKPEYIAYLTKAAKDGDMQAYHQLERQGIYVDLSDEDEPTPSAMMIPRQLRSNPPASQAQKEFVGAVSNVQTRSKRQKYVRQGRKVIGVKC